jgi:hypothetical protein
MHTDTHTRIHTRTQIHIRAYTHAQIHIRAYTHAHRHILTRTRTHAGYFAAAELAVRPHQIGQAMQLFGFVPGLEYATAAAWALDKELQVSF